jgi:hypothetical protein
VKYFGIFKDRDSVAMEFDEGTGSRWSEKEPFVPAPDFPTDDEIIIASYGHEGYEGDAFVLFERGGRLFEVHGSHCSCYGLEDQWGPEETTWEAIAMRPWDKSEYDNPLRDYFHGSEAAARMVEILKTRVGVAA